MAPRKVGMVDGDRVEWMHVRAMAMPCGLGARPRITGPPCGSSICHVGARWHMGRTGTSTCVSSLSRGCSHLSLLTYYSPLHPMEVKAG